jgi:hypothetical protein
MFYVMIAAPIPHLPSKLTIIYRIIRITLVATDMHIYFRQSNTLREKSTFDDIEFYKDYLTVKR